MCAICDAKVVCTYVSTAIHLPHGHTVSSDSFRNFITLELNTPRQSLHRAAGLKLKVQSFEAVVWLPIVDMVSSVLGSFRLSGEKEIKHAEVCVFPHRISCSFTNLLQCDTCR